MPRVHLSNRTLMALSPLKEEASDHGVSGTGSSENQSHLLDTAEDEKIRLGLLDFDSL